jgi:hypothetical protein
MPGHRGLFGSSRQDSAGTGGNSSAPGNPGDGGNGGDASIPKIQIPEPIDETELRVKRIEPKTKELKALADSDSENEEENIQAKKSINLQIIVRKHLTNTKFIIRCLLHYQKFRKKFEKIKKLVNP